MYGGARVVKFRETEVEWWLTGGGEGDSGRLCNEFGVSVLQDEKSSGDWLSDVRNVRNTTDLYV